MKTILKRMTVVPKLTFPREQGLSADNIPLAHPQTYDKQNEQNHESSALKIIL